MKNIVSKILMLISVLLVSGCAFSSKPRQLTAFGYGPIWSNDGKMIAFYSDQDGDDDIYVVNADGSDVKNITDNHADDSFLSWSPDGKQIAYTSTVGDSANIFIVNSDGSNNHLIHEGGYYPSWSPDGKHIAFTAISSGERRLAIYIMKPDGTAKKMLHENGFMPIWSPDGKKIAFYSSYTMKSGNDTWQAFIMNSDGTDTQIFCGGDNGGCTDLAWSPDGKKIVFDYYDDQGSQDIYLVNSDGSHLKKIADDVNRKFHDSQWSPDGSKIVFAGGNAIWEISMK